MNDKAKSGSVIFSHLALCVADLARSRAFYCGALGFTAGEEYLSSGHRVAKLLECPASGFEGCFLRRGDTLLELLCYAEGAPGEVTPRRPQEHGFAHVGFTVDDIDTVTAAIERHGGALRTRLDHSFGSKPEQPRTIIMFCTDPDGNRIELIAHPSSAERDAHTAFLGLHQIGWPAGLEKTLAFSPHCNPPGQRAD
jgi:catechol 2,3-dioxygenase-like lactoylglutathione lyase family enzyme